ncbi:MAG: TrkA C-terminal domain-containing protein, partial [Oscillospiraceae bacterium]
AKYTIARVRNVEYAEELSSMKKEMGIDMAINPENATAVEISRLLRFPNAANIETFYRGRVELISFITEERDFINGKPISALSRQLHDFSILFCAIERGSHVFIPRGDFVIMPEDKVYLIGEPLGISRFFKTLGRNMPRIKEVFIVGGGRIAYYLTSIVEKLGMHVKLVEKNMDRCRQLAEALPHTMLIAGDGT